MSKRAFPKVVAQIGDDNVIRVNGREGETLLMLARKGTHGVNAFDFAGGPPYRLAAYTHGLRRQGVSIQTRRESHEGGWHARYVAEVPIRVISERWS